MTKPNTTILKIISLLSIVRWYNVLIVTLALFFSALFLFNSFGNALSIILDHKLHLAIGSIAFLMMAGFIINAFYDFEKDIINRPEETVFGRIVSKSFCLNSYVVFIVIGLLLAFFVSWKVLVFNFCFSFGLWLYSHKLRKKAFTGEISAALLTIAPFFSLSLYYNHFNRMTVLFIGYIFVLSITREIIKKMIAIKGDLIVGEHSLPIIIGIRQSKYILLAWMLLAIGCIAALYQNIKDLPIAYYFIFATSIIFFSIARLRSSKAPHHFELLNSLYKVLIILGILSIPLVHVF